MTADFQSARAVTQGMNTQTLKKDGIGTKKKIFRDTSVPRGDQESLSFFFLLGADNPTQSP